MKKILFIIIAIVLLLALFYSLSSCTGCSRSGQRHAANKLAQASHMDTVITTSHVPIQYQVMREDGQVLWVGNPERVDAVEGDTLTIRQYETMFMPEEARIVYGFYKGTLPGNFSDSTGYETFYKATVIK